MRVYICFFHTGLQQAIESRGAVLVFLPPYSPQYNPIETAFSLVKRYILKNANIIFGHSPEECLDAAFKNCANKKGVAMNLYNHCRYYNNVFDDRL